MRYITKLTGDEMRRIRRRAEMNLIEFSEEFSLDATTIRQMESGRNPIRKVTAMAVRFFEAHYLGGPEN